MVYIIVLHYIYCRLLIIGSPGVTCDKVLPQIIVPKFRASQPVTQLMNFSFSETALASTDKFRAVTIILLALEGFAIIEEICHCFHHLFF